ncbi:pore-forming ESAT-6 family protein [Micromonospora sp. NPDC049559]|uniref:pore-forming ESAT-6 family protein n=1 Tax=Micromonospora sp. NPDC049559 TaxID=3155923 RepID=UPI0034178F31
MATQDRISYDTGASAEAQGNLQSVVSRLEAVIGDRDQAVKSAMADFQADGVSDLYHDKEVRWNNAAQEVRNIIGLIKKTLGDNDATASQAQSRARSAVDSI